MHSKVNAQAHTTNRQHRTEQNKTKQNRTTKKKNYTKNNTSFLTEFRILSLNTRFCFGFTEKSPSIRSDVNKADQVSLIRSSLTSLSASPSGMVACKLCLNDVKADKMAKIHQCGCQFCIDVSNSEFNRFQLNNFGNLPSSIFDLRSIYFCSV